MNSQGINTSREKRLEVIGAKFPIKDVREFHHICKLENMTTSEKLREIVIEYIKNYRASVAKPAVTVNPRPHYPSFNPPTYMSLNNGVDWHKNAYIGSELLGAAIWGACMLLNGKGK
jgi:hypothetical protein